MNHTVVVMASADDPAAMQYIAPYAGCAIGEEFMESGRDALVVYDDLSKHAWRIVKFLCSCAVRLGVRLTRAMFFTCIRAYWNAPHASRLTM